MPRSASVRASPASTAPPWHSFPRETPEYAQALTKSLFADPAVQSAFTQALPAPSPRDWTLRLRIFIGPSAPELHSLHWETLLHPQDETPLATNENYSLLPLPDQPGLASHPSATQEPAERPGGHRQSQNLSDYQNLAPIDVEGELNRAREGLGSIPVTPSHQSSLQQGGKASRTPP